MTTHAKPPAPMEPLKPCPLCGAPAEWMRFEDGRQEPDGDCLAVSCTNYLCLIRTRAIGFWRWTLDRGAHSIRPEVEASLTTIWNRRAAPSPSDGEVGELSALCNQVAEDRSDDGLVFNVLRKAAAALSRQSAELAEARELVALHQEAASERMDKIMGAIDECQDRCEPCLDAIRSHLYDTQIADCMKCGKAVIIGECWEAGHPVRKALPIPGAGAKGDSHE